MEDVDVNKVRCHKKPRHVYEHFSVNIGTLSYSFFFIVFCHIHARSWNVIDHTITHLASETYLLKGVLYSEGTDAFVISSNRWTLIFSWAWILKLWDFKEVKSCHKRAWSGSEGSNKALFCNVGLQIALGSYLTWFEPFKM